MPTSPKNDALGVALAAWRNSGTQPRFTDATRESILQQARHARQDAELPRLASLFMPIAKIAYAGAVPVLLLALTLGWLGATVPLDSGPDAVRIEAGKVDGEAVFRIANGGRVHQVYRSTSPRANAQRELLAATDEQFSDRLGGTTGIVYYRID